MVISVKSQILIDKFLMEGSENTLNCLKEIFFYKLNIYLLS